MSRNFYPAIPTSLSSAFEHDKAFALKQKRLNVERLAELQGMSPASLYKHIEQCSLPINRLIGWSHMTGGDAVIRYLAASLNKVVIDMPTGKRCEAQDVQALQAAMHEAVGALLKYAQGTLERDACMAQLSTAMECLAWHRENVKKSDQPELDFQA